MGGGGVESIGSVGPSNDTAKSVLQSSRWQCHHSCALVCLCGCRALRCVVPRARKRVRNNTKVSLLRTIVSVCEGIILTCACVCMCQCVCACVRARSLD